VLFLLTIAALGLVVWRQWYAVEPLRQEVRRLRKELGYLVIEDPTKVHFIQAERPYDNDTHWTWRIYLPHGGEYHLNVYSGPWPADAHTPFPDHSVRREPFEAAWRQRRANLSRWPLPTGEFQLDAILYYDNVDGWVVGARPGKKHLIDDPQFDKWLPPKNQPKYVPMLRRLDPGQSRMLLHLDDPVIDVNQQTGAILVKHGAVGASCIAIWIEQKVPSSGNPATTSQAVR
jgi:hypothetical protein